MAGGAEWYVRNISVELVRRGHEVHVFTGDSFRGKVLKQKNEEVDGVQVHRLSFWVNMTYRVKVWRGLTQALSSEEFDVIHAYDYAQPHAYSAIKTGKRNKTPTALTVFDVHSMIPRPFYKKVPIDIFDQYFSKFTLANADAVLVRAPNLMSTLIEMGAVEDRTYVTPSGVTEEALIKRNGRLFRSKYSISKKPIIMFLGRLHPVKGPQHLLKSAVKVVERYPEAYFMFIGPDHINYIDTLRRIVTRENLENNVLFTGPIYDFEMKMEAFAASDMFVLPSAYEGTSQSIFQAMAARKPIISTNGGGIPFQVENGKEALLIDYGDEEALASSILTILGNKTLADELAARANEKVKQFTYPKLVNQLEQIYSKLITEREKEL
jgi:glycosyltransferase involved in cell wall biosynthesis